MVEFSTVWPHLTLGLGLTMLLAPVLTRPALAQPQAGTPQNAAPLTTKGRVISDPTPPANLPDAGPSSPLVGLLYAPDGETVYSLDQSGELRGRDVNSGKTLLKTVLRSQAMGKATGFVGPLRMTKAGALYVGQTDGSVAHYAPPVVGQPPKILGQMMPAPAEEVTNTERVMLRLDDVSLSPDESYAAVTLATTRFSETPRTSSQTLQVNIWDAKTHTLIVALPPLTLPVQAKGARLTWSNDGKTVIVARPDSSLARYNAQTGATQGEWTPPQGATTPGPDPNAALQDRLQRLPPEVRERAERAMAQRAQREAEGGPRPGPGFGLNPRQAYPYTLQGVSVGGAYVLSATAGGLQLWNTQDNTSRVLERSERLPGGDQTEFSVANHLVAVRGGGGFWLWRMDGTQIGWARIPFESYSTLSFDPSGQHIALGDTTGTTRQWTTMAPLAKTPQATFGGYYAPLTALTSAPTGLLVQTERATGIVGEQGALRWLPNEPIEAPTAIPAGLQNQVRASLNALVVAPDGKSWVENLTYAPYPTSLRGLGIPPGELRARDTATGVVLWRKSDTGFAAQAPALAFLPDGTLLVGRRGGGRSAGPRDDEFAGLHAFDGRTGEEKAIDITWGDKPGFRDPGTAERLYTSANGKTLVIANAGSSEGVQAVNLATREVQSSFGANSSLPSGPWSLSPDGQWLATVAPESVSLRGLTLPEGETRLQSAVKLPLKTRVSAVCAGDGGALFVGLGDGRILKWGKGLTPTSDPQWQTAPGRTITNLTLSADGKTLWSGDERGDLTARDADSGEWKSTLRLMPPATESGAPNWSRWSRGGALQSSTP